MDQDFIQSGFCHRSLFGASHLLRVPPSPRGRGRGEGEERVQFGDCLKIATLSLFGASHLLRVPPLPRERAGVRGKARAVRRLLKN